MINFLQITAEGAIWVVLSMLLLLVSKYIYGFRMPFNTDEELKKSNLSFSVALSGYLLGIVLILIAAFMGPSKGFVTDLSSFTQYSLLGIVLLNVSRWVSDKLILDRFDDIKEIIEDKNVGTGAVHFGSHIASALIVAGAIHGEGGGIISAITFFALGQIALILFTKLYDVITPYDIHAEIESDNAAVGIAFGGNLIALGIILINGMAGNFINWQHDLISFGINALVAFAYLPLVRIIIGKLIIPGVKLNESLQNDRDVAVGFIEMVMAVSFALILAFMLF